MATKRKAAAMAASTEEDDEPIDPTDELIFTGLGGCQEVGRSCHILQYKGKTVMVRTPSTAASSTDGFFSSMRECILAEKACLRCLTSTTSTLAPSISFSSLSTWPTFLLSPNVGPPSSTKRISHENPASTALCLNDDTSLRRV